MQTEILSANPSSRIRILGVNQVGQEASNDLAVAGNSIPWLQDVLDAAWTGWLAIHRDVVILDSANRKSAVFNLTVHDLTQPAEYAALLQLLRTTAGE